MKIRALLWVLGPWVALAAGCHIDPAANPGSTGCTADSQCGPNKACYRGFCVPQPPPPSTCQDGQIAECYDGPPGTVNVGACRPGLHECRGGSFGACLGQVQPRPEIPCNGIDEDCNGVVDDAPVPENDPNNCGRCGNACVMGQSCCGNRCADTSTSTSHCTACGHACEAGMGCCNGQCTRLDVKESCGRCGGACAPGQECCNRTCVDTRTNRAHCGGCNMPCHNKTDACCNSQCAGVDSARCLGCSSDCDAMGLTCCPPVCVDRNADPNNCGRCGNMCGAGQHCCGASCVADDEAHCGGCMACPQGQLCCGGVCYPSSASRCHACGTSCAPGQLCCESGCANPRTDDRHCGSCDTDCTQSGRHCANGICCPPGQHETEGICCDEGRTNCSGRCVNTNSDGSNCGYCGNSCFLHACIGGGCVL